MPRIGERGYQPPQPPPPPRRNTPRQDIIVIEDLNFSALKLIGLKITPLMK